MDLDVIRGTGAVLFVLGLLASTLWALRRAGWSARGAKNGSSAGLRLCGARTVSRPGDNSRALLVLERKNLTPQHAVHLLRAGEREWLIATHTQGCTLLTELTTPTSAANSEDAPA